jgi:hypothetical protein
MEYGILAPCKVKGLEEPPAEAKILFLHIFALIPVNTVCIHDISTHWIVEVCNLTIITYP